jgi:nucleotide-binding universal stress UspA family protein
VSGAPRRAGATDADRPPPPTSWTKILCATDFGESADAAIREADRAARGTGAELHVIHVLEGTFPGVAMTPELVQQTLIYRERLTPQVMAAIVERVTDRTGRGADELSVIVEDGPVSARIVEAAEELGADLIVVGSTGAIALRERLLGGVADRVVRHAHGSVLVARATPGGEAARPGEPAGSGPSRRGRIVVASDLSSYSRGALDVAAAEARRRGAQLTIVHAFETPELAMGGIGATEPFPVLSPDDLERARVTIRARLRGELARVGIDGDPILLDGRPAEVIPKLAGDVRADLLVVGSAGLTGLRRIIFGSVAEALVRHAPCSVLVVRG